MSEKYWVITYVWCDTGPSVSEWNWSNCLWCGTLSEWALWGANQPVRRYTVFAFEADPETVDALKERLHIYVNDLEPYLPAPTPETGPAATGNGGSTAENDVGRES